MPTKEINEESNFSADTSKWIKLMSPLMKSTIKSRWHWTIRTPRRLQSATCHCSRSTNHCRGRRLKNSWVSFEFICFTPQFYSCKFRWKTLSRLPAPRSSFVVATRSTRWTLTCAAWGKFSRQLSRKFSWKILQSRATLTCDARWRLITIRWRTFRMVIAIVELFNHEFTLLASPIGCFSVSPKNKNSAWTWCCLWVSRPRGSWTSCGRWRLGFGSRRRHNDF